METIYRRAVKLGKIPIEWNFALTNYAKEMHVIEWGKPEMSLTLMFQSIARRMCEGSWLKANYNYLTA